MSEIVVRMPVRGQEESERLAHALDIFARLKAEQEPESDAFMMLKTELLDGAVTKSVVFQARSQAAAFLSFWRQERRRLAS